MDAIAENQIVAIDEKHNELQGELEGTDHRIERNKPEIKSVQLEIKRLQQSNGESELEASVLSSKMCAKRTSA